MSNNKCLSGLRFGLAILVSALIVPSGIVLAQVENADDVIEEIVTTGTRITNQNVIAASPVQTIGENEISLNLTPNIERIFRDLPMTIPGDGESVNNGTSGQATLDLRGLGPERSLIMIDGKRLGPYDIDGIVTTDVIPVNMLERVEIVTGGASAVYGSDAMSGAVNFILRKGFEGFEFDLGYSETDSGSATFGGGDPTLYQAVLFGSNFDDDRGNISIGASHTDRGAVLLAQREFGQFGVASSSGSGLGAPPPEPAADCSGNTEFTTAHTSGVGSTTAIPATLNLRSGNSYQFRDNGDLIAGECARFNFNPFNYYQTPQERWQATTTMDYEFNENLNFYGRVTYSTNSSDFQIAPSGTFGTAFTIPVGNPFFNAGAQSTIVGDLNTGADTFVTAQNADIARVDALVAMGSATQDDLDSRQASMDALAADPLGFSSVGIQDLNGDGVFDATDSFTSTSRRRTLELGPRTGEFKTNYFQYVLGVRGDLPGAALENWNYDVSYQYAESDFVETRDGFTNLTNLALGINTVDPDICITPLGVVTGPPCTPINIFGPVGSITDQQRADGFFIAVASDLRLATQEIFHASVDGTFDKLRIPSADDGLSLALGYEHGELTASSNPDECLKLAPASCQGGAGGNRLPVNGEYSSDEWFIEAILPIVQGKTAFENLSIEAGFRGSDFDPQGTTESWKAGISWEIFQGLRFRGMQQQAVRVPNIGELFQPVTTGLDNATLDPCSIGPTGHVPPAPGSELFNLCVNSGSGMLPTQVGTVADIIAGQINIFQGTNPVAPPRPEEANTTTFGVVWDSDFIGALTGLSISLDYYTIEIEDYIDSPTGQESLDLCYVLQDQTTCDGIVRIGGSFGETATGTPSFFTNFVAFEAEGIDLVVNTGFEAGRVGDFAVAWTAHKYLTNQFQTTALSPIVDCKGRYGTSCDPVPEFRSTFRVNWFRESLDASLLWRHIGSMDAQPNEAASLFEDFQSVDSQDYFDFNIGYSYKDWGRFSFLVRNITDENPPILGNETGSTSFNSGNTFPSLFDTMGRTYTVNLKVTF